MDDDVLLVSHGTEWMPADPALPLLPADDLAATRGDGVFEAVGVFGGTPLALDAHLGRLRRSMSAVGLVPWDTAMLEAGVRDAVRRHPSVPEVLVKLYVSHGLDGGSAWAWIRAQRNADHRGARTGGLAVTLLDRGAPRGAGRDAPWTLSGVKSLSYAPQRAALREAQRRGADDAVYVSSDGYLLKGQNSTLVLAHAGAFSTPDPDDGALAGTTQAHLFAGLRRLGHPASVRSLRVDELRKADAAWLCSSGRLIAPIHAVDGTPVHRSAEATCALWRALGLGIVPTGAPAGVAPRLDSVLQEVSAE